MSEKESKPQSTLPAPIEVSRALIREIAMDIGKEVAAHIETMYPAAVAATTPNMLLSVRNCVHNEIMAALDTVDEVEIRERLERRKRQRRRSRAFYRKLRGQDVGEEVLNDA